MREKRRERETETEKDRERQRETETIIRAPSSAGLPDCTDWGMPLITWSFSLLPLVWFPRREKVGRGRWRKKQEGGGERGERGREG